MAEYKLKKPLPFAPKGTKVRIKKTQFGNYEIIIHATDGHHYHDASEAELTEWEKFVKPLKKKGK